LSKDQNGARNWIGVASAAIVAITAAAAYFFPRAPSTPNLEVRAEGSNSIAAGHDVNIKERSTVDVHDWGGDRRREAESYLQNAWEACQALMAKISELAADSNLDMANMAQYNPEELRPTAVVAQEYGEKVYNDISSRVEQTQNDFGPVSRILGVNSVMQLTGTTQRAEMKSKQRSGFEVVKMKWLDNTMNLCTYLRSVHKGGV